MRRALAHALLIAGSIALAAAATPALAQSAGTTAKPAPGTPLETPDGVKPSGGVTTPIAPGNLSSTLARSNGVLTPPAHVDPGMTAPAPATGPQSTPVIPPPGTPGGDRSVTPK